MNAARQLLILVLLESLGLLSPHVQAAETLPGSPIWLGEIHRRDGGQIVASPRAAPEKRSPGVPLAARAAVIYPPSVPQPESADDIVGFNIQNTDNAATEPRIITFGQVFAPGQVTEADSLIAKFDGAQTAVQLDALASWPDGSVKLASLALQLPRLGALAQLPAILSRNTRTTVRAAPVSMSSANPGLTVTLDFSSGSYSGRRTIDLGAALRKALNGGKPDYWLQGPLVSQARIDVPLAGGQSLSTSTLHLTADVSVFADGSATADVQFNNDLTTVIPKTGHVNPQAPLPPLSYSATIDFQGKQTTHTVSQFQYTSWHAILWSNTPPTVNIQHDVAQLQRTGAILPYDLATGVNASLLQDYERNFLQKPGFGRPLASNGVSPYMPMTGGRPDIGFTTQYNTVWLLTQDARAAKVAMAQSDTSGAIPWNYKLANGHWLTPASHADAWIDPRGGPHGNTSGIANTANRSVWTADNAHQPNLNYVPSLMTGSRWHLDRLNAQAAYNLVVSWPGARCKATQCDILLNGTDQVRGQAWGFRELMQAAFVARRGSSEHEYFTQAVSDNWTYLRTQQAAWAARQGEATGWMPGAYGNSGATAEWQQDFLTAVAIMAALMGDDRARQFIAWQRPWLTGRFIGPGMNPYDGCNYNLAVIDVRTGTYLNTWSAIEHATIAAKLSNGTRWPNGGGYFCALARTALYGALILSPGDTSLQRALSWLESSGAPYTDQTSFRNDPTYNVGRSR